jgi:hypothetical protein
MVYRPGLFQDIRATLARWNEYCESQKIGKLFLVMTQTCFEGQKDPRSFGFDAAVEFPPHNMTLVDAKDRVELFCEDFKGKIYDSEALIRENLRKKKTDYVLFRGVFPEWDNTARNMKPSIYVNTSPLLYQKWLEGEIDYVRSNNASDERFIFINAWNEWAEGAYLEPDRKYGYAYLAATARALGKS